MGAAASQKEYMGTFEDTGKEQQNINAINWILT